ncbi:MAG: hypothetical protein KF804_11000 [Burkholderiales bacterium]|nr:hypothetical protein [Burkholderiales bacterium]
MDTASLDDFSRDVAKHLFAQFPQWQGLAKIERADDGSGYLRLEVEAPPGSSAANGLSVTTSYGEMIVGFDYYHGHFGAQIGDGGAESAVRFVVDLVNEKIPVVSWWEEGELVAWSTIEDGRPLLPDDLIGQYDRVRIRSWKGTLNVDRDA